jgi:hypothetical protein
MTDIDDRLRDIAEIRGIMERSTKFLSLSGFSGIGAGIVALAGAWVGGEILAADQVVLDAAVTDLPPALRTDLVLLGVAVLALALVIAWFFSRRIIRQQGISVSAQAMRYLLLSLAVPVTLGAIASLYFLSHGILWLVVPSMLLFYGLGLFSAGTFTFGEARTVGVLQILLGLAAAVVPAYGLLFWAAGFGVVHIVYGILFFRKYRR